MAYQDINNGTVPGDGTGEVTFSAWQKAKEMFQELYQLFTDRDSFPFLTINSSLIKKTGVNINRTTIENGDIVLWKELTNGGDPITLTGAWTYNGGDEQLYSNYSMNQTVSS